MVYTVTCRRSGDWWAITVPDLRGVHSQARRLDKVAPMAREAIALMLDVDPATIEVDVRPHVPARVAGAFQLRPGVGAHGEGDDEAAAVADLREALTGLITEYVTVAEIVAGTGLTVGEVRRRARAGNWHRRPVRDGGRGRPRLAYRLTEVLESFGVSELVTPPTCDK